MGNDTWAHAVGEESTFPDPFQGEALGGHPQVQCGAFHDVRQQYFYVTDDGITPLPIS